MGIYPNVDSLQVLPYASSRLLPYASYRLMPPLATPTLMVN